MTNKSIKQQICTKNIHQYNKPVVFKTKALNKTEQASTVLAEARYMQKFVFVIKGIIHSKCHHLHKIRNSE